MQSSRSESLNKAFVLTGKDASDLNKSVRDFIRANGTVSITIKCTDMTRNPGDIEDLKKYKNEAIAAIKQLTLEGRSDDRKRTCSISLSEDWFWGNVHVRAEGGDESVSTFFDNVKSCLEAMEPWYGRLAVLNFANIFFTAFGWICSVLAAISILCTIVFRDISFVTTVDAKAFGIYIAIVCFGLLVSLSMNSARSYFFPIGVFAIGNGEIRSRNAESFRRGFLFVGVVLATVVGIAVNSLSSVFSNATPTADKVTAPATSGIKSSPD